MSWKIVYHHEITEDVGRLPKNIKKRIQQAIENRLIFDPLKYGNPLKRSLYGLWKLRVGDYRIIYRLNENQILVLMIGHRKEVYEKIQIRARRG